MDDVALNQLSGKIIGACIEVHRCLGPGLLESVYMECLCKELQFRGIGYQRELAIPIIYKGSECKSVFRADLVVENTVIVELKAVKEMLPVYEAQVMTYLTLSNLSLGLLINFNVPLLRDGIHRIRLNYGKLSNHDLDNLIIEGSK
ncbi:MAG: GxxExxY protein [Candidatus Cloacimonetes bacterium HGW-Cloacimonetes-3]|jgi:GxxExxY protein|nr:MAG: GxxExxY protein [Candidatus Cloacimonetes bacterium HGW-Cloacimonetes-3]